MILNSIADGVFTTDNDGKITFMNKAGEEITGFSNKEAIGHYCFDVFRADICQSRCALKETLMTKKEIINLPATILKKGGQKVPISISTAVLKNERGQIIGGVETFRDLSVIEELKKELFEKYTLGDIISKNYLIHNIFNILPNIAESDSTVLIQGASGTGKELFAKAIHHLSRRRIKPFIKVNCGALPDTLLESELFGYVKGAFTDAKKDKPGRFALANEGTIFLDEIGDMSPSLQVKLLRVLQEREYEPLGSISPRKTDVRIIAATNKDISKLVNDGKFRDDLFYRLNVVKIELPPLSQRREDIPLLIDAFIQKFNAKMGKQITGVSDQALRLLLKHDYPGNVRELENIIEHAFVLCRGERIDLDCLPKELIDGQEGMPLPLPLKEETLFRRAEAEIIERTLKKYGGNRAKTAQELGIDRTTLWRKMRKYDLL
ncbi:MAG: Fis family transcriptional regulator [Deltaproteobacteria bacterium RBG_19FT_COMBO_46_12]|nr:MAG: Fis family transcriptional regulator [Deltaproteobacteria bacterium RBG_19FT_COMBO_46_12]